MEALEDRSTYNYLALEFYEKDEDKEKEYDDKHLLAHRKIVAIEQAFASAIGKDAISELEQSKKLGFNSVNQKGELAPEGFEFDHSYELRPIKK